MQQQRLQHIVNSYTLAGEDPNAFEVRLNALLTTVPWFLLELALVDVLAQNWLRYPMPRGLLFLEQVRSRLAQWREDSAISTPLTPDQFEQITGLTPLSFQLLATPVTKVANATQVLVIEGGLSDRQYPAH